MQAVDAFFRETHELLARIIDARLAQRLRVVFVAREQLDDGRRQARAAHEHHALDLRLRKKRHDAKRDRHGNARLARGIEESQRKIVIEEQLRDEELRARVLLFLQMANALVEIEAIDMAFRIRRSAYAKTSLARNGNQVFGEFEIFRSRARHRVAAQGEHIFNTRRLHRCKHGIDARAIGVHTRKVGHHVQAVFVLRHFRHVNRARGIARSSR